MRSVLCVHSHPEVQSYVRSPRQQSVFLSCLLLLSLVLRCWRIAHTWNLQQLLPCEKPNPRRGSRIRRREGRERNVSSQLSDCPDVWACEQFNTKKQTQAVKHICMILGSALQIVTDVRMNLIFISSHGFCGSRTDAHPALLNYKWSAVFGFIYITDTLTSAVCSNRAVVLRPITLWKISIKIGFCLAVNDPIHTGSLKRYCCCGFFYDVLYLYGYLSWCKQACVSSWRNIRFRSIRQRGCMRTRPQH